MRISIIPIFIPHIGCPYRCVFCNQWKITGHTGVPSPAAVAAMIRSYTEGVQDKRHWEVAFYGGSFTAIDGTLQEQLLQPAYEALANGQIDAIRCSTRPDCIDNDIMDRLHRYGMTIVELGVQSMDDTVLKNANRGHTAEQVCKATESLQKNGFLVGHQLMPGLPGEDWNSLKMTTQAIVQLHPDMTRIYPVAVIEGTQLAEMYHTGDYKPLTIHEGVCRAAYMKQCFSENNIACIRTGLQATDTLNDITQVIAGAYTPAMGEMVDTKRYQQQLFALLETIPGSTAGIFYNRCDTSRVRGIRNVTVKRAKLCCRQVLTWHEDGTVTAGTIRVETTASQRYIIHVDSRTIDIL